MNGNGTQVCRRVRAWWRGVYTKLYIDAQDEDIDVGGGKMFLHVAVTNTNLNTLTQNYSLHIVPTYSQHYPTSVMLESFCMGFPPIGGMDVYQSTGT